jgi:hypothetical protein
VLSVVLSGAFLAKREARTGSLFSEFLPELVPVMCLALHPSSFCGCAAVYKSPYTRRLDKQLFVAVSSYKQSVSLISLD